MRVVIEIQTGNAAMRYADDITYTLTQLIERLKSASGQEIDTLTLFPVKLRDLNGNVVGTADLKEDSQ